MSFEVTQVVLSGLGLIINLFGFIFVIRQIKQQALATRGETYTSLCGLSYDILRMIADKPYLYPYFYERRALEQGYEHRVDVLMCCEMIANYIDNTLTQKENMPESVFQKWLVFTCQSIEMSVVLHDFFDSYAEWYDPQIALICDEVRRANSAGA